MCVVFLVFCFCVFVECLSVVLVVLVHCVSFSACVFCTLLYSSMSSRFFHGVQHNNLA